MPGALPECKLSGELMTEEAYLKQFENEPGHVVATLVFKQYLSYYLGNYQLAAELSDKTQGYAEKYVSGDSPAMRYLFFDCMTAFTMLRRKGHLLGNRKWRRRKSKCMQKFATWRKKGNSNIHHMFLILEAEEYSLRKKVDLQLGRSKFDAAIAAAGRAGFMQDSALAIERAGAFCAANNDSHWASVYLTRAHGRWAEYGALAICDQLANRYPEYITEGTMRASTRSVELAMRRVDRSSRKSAIFKDTSESWQMIKKTTVQGSVTNPQAVDADLQLTDLRLCSETTDE